MSDAPAIQQTAAVAVAVADPVTVTAPPVTSTSASSSTSSPAPNAGPPATAPSPLLIGKAFIKQYYQVLSTNPAQITKFYKPNSLISHSLLPSVPGITKTLKEYQDDKTSTSTNTNALFAWCRPEKGDKLCFDFGRGAIDAQETINGGILLIVTGHIRLPCWKADGEDDGMKRFVHTFFLNNGAPAGKKRQFYVHNDVLRFMDQGVVLDSDSDSDSSIVEVEYKQTDEVVSVSEKESVSVQVPESPVQGEEAALAAVVNEKKTASRQDDSKKSEVDTEGPADDVVNDSKEGEKKDTAVTAVSNPVIVAEKRVVDVDADAADVAKKDTTRNVVSTTASAEEGTKEKSAESSIKDAGAKKGGKNTASKSNKSEEKKGKSDATTLQEKKPRKNKSRGRARKSRSSSPTDGNVSSKGKKATAGSWASLVAGGSGPSAVAAAAADAAAEISKEEKQNSASAPAAANTKKSSKSNTKKEAKSEQEAKGEQASSDQQSESQPQQEQQQQQQQQQLLSKKAAAAQRTPEATVLIKNIPDRTKEPEIRAMFEPYASNLKKRILGITLLANRGFCFVDFDSKDVVDDIVKAVEAEKDAKAKSKKDGGDDTVSKFTINRRALEVGRKIPADKAVSGGRGRGPRRSSSPNHGGGFKNNRGGGRRNSPRGGTRSGNKK